MLRILLALTLPLLFAACASGGGADTKKNKPAASMDGEDDAPLENTGGSRVCGWSDTGRWECTGPKPETKPEAKQKPKRSPTPAKKSTTPAAPTPDIVTDPIPEGDL